MEYNFDEVLGLYGKVTWCTNTKWRK